MKFHSITNLVEGEALTPVRVGSTDVENVTSDEEGLLEGT